MMAIITVITYVIRRKSLVIMLSLVMMEDIINMKLEEKNNMLQDHGVQHQNEVQEEAL